MQSKHGRDWMWWWEGRERKRIPHIYWYTHIRTGKMHGKGYEAFNKFCGRCFRSAVAEHVQQTSNYARILFLDFTSAFNTMKIHILMQRLIDLGVNGGLIWWIKDFLSNRPQRVEQWFWIQELHKEQFYHPYFFLYTLMSLKLKTRFSVFLNMPMIWLSWIFWVFEVMAGLLHILST